METTYEVKVVTTVYVEVKAKNDEQAIERACAEAWLQDADELNAEIIRKGE